MSFVGNRSVWLRIYVCLLVGGLFGAPLDMICQLLVYRGNSDGVYPPLFGIVACSVVVFCFWNRLAQVQLPGILRTIAIGTLIGMASGAILGAAVYPPLRMAMGRAPSMATVDEASVIYQVEGTFVGLGVGGLIGAFTGAVINLFRKPVQRP